MQAEPQLYFADFLVALERFGLGIVSDTGTSEILARWHAKDEPPILAATVLAAHQMAEDYLSLQPVRIVRSSDTALIVLTVLHEFLKADRITEAQRAKGISLAAPYLDPGEKTTKHAEDIIAFFGENSLAICKRNPSSRMLNSQKLLETAYKDYLETQE